MMCRVTFWFVDANGNDISDTERCAGYRASAYFDDYISDIERMDAASARVALATAYKGLDCDGVGLAWDVE